MASYLDHFPPVTSREPGTAEVRLSRRIKLGSVTGTKS